MDVGINSGVESIILFGWVAKGLGSEGLSGNIRFEDFAIEFSKDNE